MPPSHYRLASLGEPIGHGASRTCRVLLQAVAKQNGGRGAAYCLPNELICGELARFLRLPAPPVALVALPGEEARVASLDFNFTDHPLSPVDVDACLHLLPSLSAGLLLFDIWIANPDRHNGNFHVDFQCSPPRLNFFDHGQALLGHVPGEAVARMERLQGKLATVSCFLARISEDTHFPLWLERIRATPDFFIEELCAEARPYGLTDEECAAASAFLKSRRDSLAALINADRPAFKSMLTWTLPTS